MASFTLKNSKMAGRIKDIQKKSIEQGIIAKNIPLSEIDSNPDNEKIFSLQDIELLAEEIDKNGFQGVITVFMKENGRYEISSGHRRYLAMKHLNAETIPCVIMTMPEDDAKKADILLSSNFESRHLKPMDYARAIQYFEEIHKKKKDYSGTLADYAMKSFHISRSEYFRYKELNKLIPELMELANDDRVSYSAFREKSCTELSKPQQGILAEKITERLRETDDSLSRRDIVQMADIILGREVKVPVTAAIENNAANNEADDTVWDNETGISKTQDAQIDPVPDSKTTLEVNTAADNTKSSQQDKPKEKKQASTTMPDNTNACKDPDNFLLITVNGLRDIIDYEAKFKNSNEAVRDMAEELKNLSEALIASLE